MVGCAQDGVSLDMITWGHFEQLFVGAMQIREGHMCVQSFVILHYIAPSSPQTILHYDLLQRLAP